MHGRMPPHLARFLLQLEQKAQRPQERRDGRIHHGGHALLQQLLNQRLHAHEARGERKQHNPTHVLFSKINNLLTEYNIADYYRVTITEQGVNIRESSMLQALAPNVRDKIVSQFKQMVKQKLAGECVASFSEQSIGIARGVHLNVPSWNFNPAPTNDDVFRFFEPLLQSECKEMHGFIQSARILLQSAPRMEEKLGETHVGVISASIPTIPVSFPDSPNEIFDLCDVLRLVPERDGLIENPLTRKHVRLSELIPRQDVVDVLSDRILAQSNPVEYIKKLLTSQTSQSDDDKKLSESVIDKLSLLKPDQYKTILSCITDPRKIAKIGKYPRLSLSFITNLTRYLLPLIEYKELKSCSPDEIKTFFDALLSFETPAQQADLMMQHWKNLDVIIDWLEKIQNLATTSFFNKKCYQALLTELTHRKILDEFEARYGIKGESVRESKENIIITFTTEAYQALLREYDDKPEFLPFVYPEVDGHREVTLTKTQYQQILKDNKKNTKDLLTEFQRYQSHLVASEASVVKRTFQQDQKDKKTETEKLISTLNDSKTEIPKTDAQKLIAFRKQLYTSAEKLNPRRDGWLLWLMKAVATALSIGGAHFLFKIWEVEGREHVHQAKAKLMPKRGS